MGANSVKIPVELEMSSIQSQIGALRTALKGVKEDTSSFRRLNTILSSIEKQFSALQTESKKTFSSQIEINRFNKNLEKLNISTQIFKDNLSQIDVNDLKIDLTSFNEAVKKVNEFRAVIDNAGNAKGLFDNVKEVQKVLTKKTKIETFDEFFDAFDEEADKVNKKIDEVKRNITDLNSQKLIKSNVEKEINAIKSRNSGAVLDSKKAESASEEIARKLNFNTAINVRKGASRQDFINMQQAELKKAPSYTNILKRIQQLQKVLDAIDKINEGDAASFTEAHKATLSASKIKYEGQGSTFGEIKKDLNNQITALHQSADNMVAEINKIANNIPVINDIINENAVAKEIDKKINELTGVSQRSMNPMGQTEGLDAYIKRRLAAVDTYNAEIDKKTQNATNELPNYDAALKEIEYARVIVEAKYAEMLALVAAARSELPDAKLNLQEQTKIIKENAEAAQNVAPVMEQMGSAIERAGDRAAESSASLSVLNTATDKLSHIKNVVGYWLSFQSIMRGITNVVKNAGKTIHELDDVMTEISIVTDMTQEDLWKQMDTYSSIAVEYGTSIKGVYKISQLYYQQGLQTNEVMELTTETLKMAKIAGLDYAISADYMTSAIRGFRMEMTEAQRVTDVYSALAAATASDTEELAVAMSKTASSADAVGSSFEATSAMIATMVSVTRESATNINRKLDFFYLNVI